MRKTICNLLLLGAIGALGSPSTVYGQAATATQPAAGPEIGVMYVAEDTQYISGSHLWLQGASGEVAFPVMGHFSGVFNVTGDSSAGKNGGVPIATLSVTVGPRYVWKLPARLHRSRLFGEGLIGFAHGFNATYPSQTGTTQSWNTFAAQLGGGYDIDLKHHIALRVIDLHYVRTQFPNGTGNVQNNFRIGAGIIFRLPPA